MNEKSTIVKSREKTRRLAQTAMLAAIVMILTFTPLGYIPMPGGVEMTIVMIPVAIGTIVVGPACGAVLGAVWGVTSFMQCFGIIRPSGFGELIVGINPIATFIMCIPARILAGWLSGLIHRLIAGDGTNKVRATSAAFVGALTTALINTVLFVSAFVIFFSGTELLGGMMAGRTFIGFLAFFIGANGLIEAALTVVVGGAVAIALKRVLKRI